MRTPLHVLLILLATPVIACDTATVTRIGGTGAGGLSGETCFVGTTAGGTTVPLTKVIHTLRATERGDEIDVTIIFHREFVDNTYGTGAIGWESRRKGHTFQDLFKSDHTELVLLDQADEERFRAKIDYLSESPSAPSGYASLGVSGGDGELFTGEGDDVVSFGSSMDDNLNTHGYVLTDSSPGTDSSYTPNPSYPSWNFWVEYRLTVRGATFEPEGFGRPEMAMVHASPSKWVEGNTVEVEPGDCPPEGSENNPFPPTCVLEEGCGDGAGGGGDETPPPDGAGSGDPGGI